MKCGSVCGTENSAGKEFQDLSGWKGITLDELRKRIEEQPNDEVRIYTVATTRLDKKSKIVGHIGSGPNLEGGLATLCTCKHSMRCNHSANAWKDKWILGLTSRAINNGFSGEHYFFYLMKIEQAFFSHKELCEYLMGKNKEALRIKNAVTNRLGDIYVPKSVCTNQLDHTMYETPHINHSHGKNGEWHDDIAYKSNSAPLLLGDSKNTFVWKKPMIVFKQKRGIGNMKLTLKEVLSDNFVSDES